MIALGFLIHDPAYTYIKNQKGIKKGGTRVLAE